MVETTYCTNPNCPFKDCKHHFSRIRNLSDKQIKVAKLDAVCRQYIDYLLTQLENESEGKIWQLYMRIGRNLEKR